MTLVSLPAAVAAREAAGPKLADAVAATARARSTTDEAKAAVDRLAAADRAAVAKHAERLEAWTLNGGAGACPVLVADAVHLQGKATADATLLAARQNLQHFEAAEARARTALASAETFEAQCRLALKRAEADRIAARITAMRLEEFQLCAQLAALELDAPAALSATARAVVENPRPVMPTAQSLHGGTGIVADVHTRLNDRTALSAARDYWRAFEQSLTGAPDPQEAAA